MIITVKRVGLMWMLVSIVSAMASSPLPAAEFYRTSFNCRKASSAVEKEICRSSDLAKADRSMGDLYKTVFSSLPDAQKSNLKNEQRNWLGKRDSCSKYSAIDACIEKAYEERGEELMKVWQKSIPALPIRKNIPTASGVKIPLVYATAPEGFEAQQFLFSKHQTDPIPVFGVPSHYYPYEGTPVTVGGLSRALYLSHVGIRVSDRRLIGDLNIEFKQITESIEYDDEPQETSFMNMLLDAVFKKSHACGPSFFYESTGESWLEFVAEKNGIVWYRTLAPIDLSRKPTMMQLFYTPNHVQGSLSIQLVSMLLVDSDRNFYSPVLESADTVDPHDLNVYDGSGLNGRNYLGYLGDEEKGAIVVQQNASGGIDVTFVNKGIDTILVDRQSLDAIELRLGSNASSDWRVKSLDVRDMDDKLVTSLPFDEIERKLSGRRIAPGKSFGIPFRRAVFDRENLYSVVITHARQATASGTGSKPSSKKVIYWQLGSSPYGHDFKNKASSPLCLVYFNKDGSTDIDEIRTGMWSYLYPSRPNSPLYTETGLRQEDLSWKHNQHVSTVLKNDRKFSWAAIVPESEVSSYIASASSSEGAIKSYSGALINRYRRDNYQGFVAMGVSDRQEVGIIYEFPETWLLKPKLAQYLLWMIKANTL